MNNEWILCLACGLIASISLLRMMRRRQLALVSLLKEYVDRQVQWNRRRAKAEAIAKADDAKKQAKAAKAAMLVNGDSASAP